MKFKWKKAYDEEEEEKSWAVVKKAPLRQRPPMPGAPGRRVNQVA